MSEEREPVTTTDVAGAIRTMARFPWDEMLEVQRAMLNALSELEEERDSLVEAFWGSEIANETDAGTAAAESTAKVVKALEEVKVLQVETAKTVSGCATSLNRSEQILVSIMSGVHDVRRGIATWGMIVTILLFLGTIDDILYLAGRLGRMFG